MDALWLHANFQKLKKLADATGGVLGCIHELRNEKQI